MNSGTGGFTASNNYKDLSRNPFNKEEIFYNTNLEVAFLIPFHLCYVRANLKVN